MSIMNFFSNLFNGSVFTVDMSEYKDRTNAAEAAAVAANTRASKLEEENAILKSDKVVLSDEIVTLKGNLSTKDSQYADAMQLIGKQTDEITELKANQRPPRVNGKFVSTKPGKATAKDAAKGTKVAKPPKIAKPAV